MSSLHYSGSDLRHSSLYSYTTKDAKLQYYTTKTDNELIDFYQFYDQEIHANFVWIESVDSSLFVTFNGTNYPIYIPAGHSREISYIDVVSMQINNPVGTKLRWYLQTF